MHTDNKRLLAVSSWLQWSPHTESNVMNSLQKYFPDALPPAPVMRRMTHALAEIGVLPDNTVFGQSICPDEINNGKGELSYQVRLLVIEVISVPLPCQKMTRLQPL